MTDDRRVITRWRVAQARQKGIVMSDPTPDQPEPGQPDPDPDQPDQPVS